MTIITAEWLRKESAYPECISWFVNKKADGIAGDYENRKGSVLMNSYGGKMKNEGYAMHCHHDILVEYCYDYEGRVAVIRNTKPEKEQEIRLRLFSLLPDEAIAEWQKIRADCQKADAKWWEARAELQKACADWQKADAKWWKAHAELQKAYAERQNSAYADVWHKKWCGCKEFKNGSIDFEK